MPNRITQQELADAIGYSQSRISTATKEGDSLRPDFMEEPFDPKECAAHKGGYFQGFDLEELPESVRDRLEEEASEEAVDKHVPSRDATPQGEQGAPLTVATPYSKPSIRNPAQVFLPAKAVEVGARPTYTSARGPVSLLRDQPGMTELLSGNKVKVQREEANASVIPKGMDVSRSVAYGSMAHVTETAVRQDPALAWAALGLTGGGIGAFAGYQAEGTAKGMAAGAAAGTAVTLVSGLIGVTVTRSGRR